MNVSVKSTCGTPQNGVISLLLWSLVVDQLLQSLKELGFECVGNDEDIVLIIKEVVE